MASKPAELGTSLLVPCVQELAKEPLTTVPPRYIRQDQDSPILSNSSSVPQIPVIDFQKLFDEESRDLELERMHHPCKHWGFFQLINHGVSSSLVEKVKLEIQDFFNFPMEEKKKYWQIPGDMVGFGLAFVVSEEQKLDWADIFYMITLPANSRKPHLFPNLPLPLRFSLSLSLSLFYMITLPSPQPELAIGLNCHTDAVGLTILLQINEVEGLQIKIDRTWVPVTPFPGAFIINIGGILEVALVIFTPFWR